LHLTSSGAGTPKINATVAALRFFFRAIIGGSLSQWFLGPIKD
jgi:hypothetical protein